MTCAVQVTQQVWRERILATGGEPRSMLRDTTEIDVIASAAR